MMAALIKENKKRAWTILWGKHRLLGSSVFLPTERIKVTITHGQEDAHLPLQGISELLGTDPVFLQNTPVCRVHDTPNSGH